MDLNEIVREIPFFTGKQVTVKSNIYLNDTFPSCFQISCEDSPYKVRIPSLFNSESVNNEIKALTILSQNKISNIPSIIEFGQTTNTYLPYLVETYHIGESLDKIYNLLNKRDWECIINQVLDFIISIQEIHGENFGTFDANHTTYDNYGMMIADRILKHLHKNTESGLLTPEINSLIHMKLCGIEAYFSGTPVFLHFDIKPQNIIYDQRSRRITIIDFEHSRYGDVSHEIYRGCIAAKRNPYFSDCWFSICNKFLKRDQIDNCEIKSYYFELFFFLSELTYANAIKDDSLVSMYLKKLHQKLLQD